jgi:hypothetical protein
MARLILTGDTEESRRYVSWARSRLAQLKTAMKNFCRRSDAKEFNFENARVLISSAFGHDLIFIEGFGGVGFLVMGYIETADDVRYANTPNKGVKYLQSRVSITGKTVSASPMTNLLYPYRGDDYTPVQGGGHRIYYLTDTCFYTGKTFNLDATHFIPSGTYPWQVRKFTYGYALKFEVTEPGVEGNASIFCEDATDIYTNGDMLVRDPTPSLWTSKGRIERRENGTGALVWAQVEPDYWHQYNATANNTDLYLISGVYMYNPGDGHTYLVPTIEKRSKVDGSLTWYVQKSPGAYLGSGGWAVRPASQIIAEADYHYVAWIEWQSVYPSEGNMLRCRIEKVANSNGTTTEWTAEYDPPFEIAESDNLNITGAVKVGNKITYCGYFTSYLAAHYIRIAFCVDADTGVILWHQEVEPAGMFDPYGHIIKDSGWYNDVKYDKNHKKLIMAGAADQDVNVNMTTAIVDIRNPDDGKLIATAPLRNGGLYVEHEFIHVMSGAGA